MSRIGKQNIQLPQGVEVKITNNHVFVKGPKGELNFECPLGITRKVDNGLVSLERNSDEKSVRSKHGMARSITANMIEGASKGFEKSLEIKGIGYKFQIKGNVLTLNLGYSHPVDFVLPKEVSAAADEKQKNVIILSSADKEMLGEIAARIRKIRPPEPYKGAGIRYSDEIIVKKAGKSAVSKSK